MEIESSSRHRLTRTRVLGLATCVLVALVYSAYVAGRHNLHSFIDSLPVHEFRIELWEYYYHHNGRPPANLRTIVPQAGSADSGLFSTQAGRQCSVEYFSQKAAGSKPIARMRCGSPTIVEFLIAPDGQIVRERWYPLAWLRASCQRNAKGPVIRIRHYEYKDRYSVPPPDFERIVKPWR